jgi:hypothetical protein
LAPDNEINKFESSLDTIVNYAGYKAYPNMAHFIYTQSGNIMTRTSTLTGFDSPYGYSTNTND